MYIAWPEHRGRNKELLGLYLPESEGARHWLEVLTGFDEAICTSFPQAEVQLWVIHQIRNSLREQGPHEIHSTDALSKLALSI